MKRKSPSKIKRVLYVFLSFVLSFVLFLMSFAVLLEFTVFNKDFIFGEMNRVSYFEIQRAEISRNLKDLGYASGLDESFFDDLIDESMLRDDTAEYLDSFYSGTGSVIRLDNFKQKFNSAIDVYIEKKGINPASVSAENRQYLGIVFMRYLHILDQMEAQGGKIYVLCYAYKLPWYACTVYSYDFNGNNEEAQHIIESIL